MQADIGKLEPHQHVLSGGSSRSIDDVNRLVYNVTDDHTAPLRLRLLRGR